MKAVKEIIYIRHNTYFNDNNISYLAPFWSDDDGKTLQIEEEQYDAWSQTDALELLSKEFETITRVKEVQHFPKDELGCDLPDWYYKVYNTILHLLTFKTPVFSFFLIFYYD